MFGVAGRSALVAGVGEAGVVGGVVEVVVVVEVTVGEGGFADVGVSCFEAALALADATMAFQSKLIGGGGDGFAKRSA